MFEMFHLCSDVYKCFICFQTYVVNVASRCFKSRSGVVHVAMRVRSEGDASGPRARFGGARRGVAGPTWACETQARRRGCAGASVGNGV
jgi:hypothetical protein